MKLHLPVALLRAVMALFATTTTFTSAWAEESIPVTITHTIRENTDYVYGGEEGNEGWKAEWDAAWRADEIIITADEEPAAGKSRPDVSFKPYNIELPAYDSIIDAEKVTIENLGNVTIDGFLGNSSNSAIFSAVEYDIRNNDAVNYTNNAGVVLTEPGNDYSIMRFVDNGEINITGNSAYLEGHFTLGAAIEDIKDVLITGTKRDITMSYNSVKSGCEWVSGSAVRLEGKLTFAGNQGDIDVSHNTGKIISGNSGDAHGGAILAFGVEITGTGGDISFNDNAVYTEGRDYAGGGAISSTGTEEIEVDGVITSVKLLGNITLSDNLGNIEFNRNKVQSGSKDAYDTDMLQVAAGGAMVAQGKVEISGNKGSLIGFNSNSVEAEVNSAGGGAIAVVGAVEIAGNKADVEALTAEDENAGNKLEFKNNSVSSLSDSVCGGAIYASNDELISVARDKLGIDYATAESLVNQLVPTYVSIDNNDDVSFIDNSITSGEVDADGKAVRYGDFADGGAIYSEGKVSLSNNADVEFSGNNATSIGSSVRGGAVYSEASVDISGNAAVTFDGNQATAYQVEYKNEYNTYYQYGSAYGGAIYMYSYPEVAGVSITGNSGLVSFTDNMAYSERGSAYGGAIYCDGDVTLQGNLAGISFIGNKVVTGIVDENGNVLVPGSSGYGGAIYARDGVTIMGNSGNITFNDNKAIATESSANGGAIYSDVSVSIKENTGDITFNNNVIESCYWAEGAAIYADEIVEIIGIGYEDGKTPGNLTFKGNSISVSDSGGRGAAIYGEHGVNLSHNGDILFENNRVDAQNGTARGAGISTCASEPETQEVAVSILSNGNVTFNNNDTSAFHNSSHGGAIHSYWGAVDIRGNKDVTFTNNDIVSRDNSESGGGAIYSEFGASIVGNGNVTISSNTASSQGGNVYGGAINTDRGSIVINKNEAVTISNNRVTAVGSFMKEVVDVDAEGNEVIVGTERAASQITAGGALASNKNVEICSNNGDIIFSQNSVTETKVDEVLPSDGWDGSGENPQLPHMAGSGAIGAGESLKMTDNVGNISFSENSVSSECKGVYGGATATIGGFVNISNNTAGIESAGTLTVDGGDSLQLGAVNFSQNKATATGSNCSAHGGAIATFTDYYGGGQVVMTGNDTVTFYYNSATSKEGAAYGGAIYAADVVALSGNGDVAFVGNKAEAYDSDGGAIFSQKGVSITNNGAVTFSGNESHADGGAIHVGSYESTPNAYVNISNNTGLVSFVDNKVTSDTICVHGAAINSFGKTASVTLSGNTAGIQFIGNMGSAEQNSSVIGGGIFCQGEIKFTGNGDILFKENSVSSKGGDAFGSAMCNSVGNIILDNNLGSVQFIGNTTSTLGGFRNKNGEWKTAGTVSGAVTTSNAVSISGNEGAVVFKENTVKETTTDKLLPSDGYPGNSKYPITSGGAVSAALGINIDNNQSVNISGNSVLSETRDALGGALATFGGVSVSGNGAVSFGNNSVIAGTVDSENVADYDRYGNNAYGGAIYGAGGVTLSSNDKVSFTDNSAKGYEVHGGAIYSAGDVLISSNKGTADEPAVNISGNTIICADDGFGGAIYAGQNSGNSISEQEFKNDVTLTGNGNIVFDNNKIVSDFRARGGAIYADGYITLSGNGDVTFTGNSVKSDHGGSAVGGAISTYLVMGSDSSKDVHTSVPVGVSLSGNGAITFSGNSSTAGRSSANGGAIHSAGKVLITDNSGDILFSHNTNEAKKANSAAGGAIAGYNGVVISGNTGESIKFEGNQNKSNGGNSGAGALYARYNDVSITDNEGVAIEFKGNSVEGVGRFVEKHSDGSETEVNVAAIAGGAIGADASSVLIKNNGAVSFTDNKVIDKDGTWLDSDDVDVEAIAPNLNVTGGGAIMSMANTEISGNAGVTISGNSATSDSRTAMGGAIAAVGSASISHNKGDVNVSGNYAASETGKAMGGAIFAQNGLSIVNNEGNVTFSGNYVKKGANHQLNSVDVQGGKVELAAVEGKSISFYDSVLVGSGSEVVLNSYSGQTTTGAIVFSGANAVETLQQLKGEGGTVSDGEISASLTSKINREVSVAGGSLQVKDGAVLQMQSLGVNKGAELLIGAGSTVGGVDKDITVTFAADSEYTVQGLKAATTMKPDEVASSTPSAAQIAGNVVLTAGMTYTMDGAYTELVGSANTLAFEGSGTYTFNVDESVAYTEGTTKYFVLFTGVDSLTGAELGLDSTVLTGVDFLTNIGYYDDIMLHYLNHEKAGGVLYISATVPEPTTATLSLLALAALAARRRRK